MATTTTNYGLTKPENNEYYDIGVANENIDKIDAAIKANADNAAAASAEKIPLSQKGVPGGVAAYDEVDKRCELIEYNVYGLQLQAYYDGKTPLQKGIILDGFRQSNNPADSAVTTTDLIDASNRIIDPSRLATVSQSTPTTSSVEIGYSDGVWNTAVLGQVFQAPTSRTLTKVRVRLSKVGSPTDAIRCQLNSGSSGSPGDNLLATATNTISGSQMGGTATEYEFSFSGYALSAGSYYTIVLSRTSDTMSPTNYYRCLVGSSPTTPNSPVYHKEYSMGWSGRGAPCIYFVVNPVPSPIVYQTLAQTPARAFTCVVLYMSTQQSGVNSFTPKLDAYDVTPTGTWTSFIKDTGYARDVGDGYTEYKYTLTLPSAKTKAKVHIDFSYTDGTLKLREYGVLCLA